MLGVQRINEVRTQQDHDFFQSEQTLNDITKQTFKLIPSPYCHLVSMQC